MRKKPQYFPLLVQEQRTGEWVG